MSEPASTTKRVPWIKVQLQKLKRKLSATLGYQDELDKSEGGVASSTIANLDGSQRGSDAESITSTHTTGKTQAAGKETGSDAESITSTRATSETQAAGKENSGAAKSITSTHATGSCNPQAAGKETGSNAESITSTRATSKTQAAGKENSGAAESITSTYATGSCNPQAAGKETGSNAESVTSTHATGKTQAAGKENCSTAKSITSTRANGNTQAPIGSAPSSASSATAPKSAPTHNQIREPPEPTGDMIQEGSYDFLGDVGTNAEDLQKCFERYEAAIKGFPLNAMRSAPAPPRKMRAWGQYASRRVRPRVGEISARGDLNGGNRHAYRGDGSQGHSGGDRN